MHATTGCAASPTGFARNVAHDILASLSLTALLPVLFCAAGEPVDLAEIMSGYKACVDWSAASSYKQLMEIYPDAKVRTL
jgi:hypothetical protein